jgi:hypothetical protein
VGLGTHNGTQFPGVSPRLRQAAARLDDIAQHLHGDSVLPYRLRDDGSFANIATTLLDAHRALCEAAILLAATGAPSATLPRSPDVLVVCPAEHRAVVEILAVAREHGHEPLAIGDDFAQLPHLVRLLAPRVVVSVCGAHDEADAATARCLALDEPTTRFVAYATSGVDPGELDRRFASLVDSPDGLCAAFAGVGSRAPDGADKVHDIDLEVVAI